MQDKNKSKAFLKTTRLERSWISVANVRISDYIMPAQGRHLVSKFQSA